ncbi:GRF1-interacting factor 1-like protein isoform X1 [Cinnamomum micranthum f. kanehirae]|uniref:GRF1-interacting factor 1-like protein isoform X1 n=1 Tax=Cinnamomum micranthum f. kanehirae TaxID=337451 RepID=A0A3S4P7A0_9MAGN|nr:GRF1-interacting factor 1-like protein isoform X1 [Cinnamomum micranthum f. kanehirae]
MQQHLMQMQPMMAAYDPNNITTDIIQQYLDENKQLILHILDCQSSGKLGECAENQARLQRNLMYLAAIADSQPQPTPFHAQFPPSAAMQPGARYLQHQQAQSMTPQSLMAARSSMLYTQQPMSALQQQASLHSQLGMIPGGNNGLHMLHGDGSMGGNGGLAARGFPDFGRSAGESLHAATSRGMTGTGKQDVGNAGSTEGRGGSAGGQNTDGTEPLYLKSSEEAN